MPADQPARAFVPVLKDMVEGRMDPAAWFQWRDANADALRAALPPGWFLRLKPRALQESMNRAASVAVDGISYVLHAMNESHEKSDRFARAWDDERRQHVEQHAAQREELLHRLKPILDSIQEHFPKFAGLLRRRLQVTDTLEPGASEEHMMAAEQALGLKIPGALRRLFRCSQRIAIDSLSIDTNHFVHPVASQLAGTDLVCIGEYWLKADGDQVLFRSADLSDDDPPVYYYAHATPKVEPTKKRFTAWLESLSRSAAFRD